MDTRQALLAEIECFLNEQKISPTAFGQLALNDGKFVGQLRHNRNLTVVTLEKVRAFIRQASEKSEAA